MTEMDKIKENQLLLAEKFGVRIYDSPLHLKVGLSKSVYIEQGPIHGLRHPPEGDTTGWYIWAGEYDESADFFDPVHVKHLLATLPIVLPYLGLPPGWRFLIDYNGYEDVWEDPTLLEI